MGVSRVGAVAMTFPRRMVFHSQPQYSPELSPPATGVAVGRPGGAFVPEDLPDPPDRGVRSAGQPRLTDTGRRPGLGCTLRGGRIGARIRALRKDQPFRAKC